MRRRRNLVGLVVVPACLLVPRPAVAQLVANGTSLTATTSNAVATFTGPDLTGFVNSATIETYLKKPSGGELSGVYAFNASGNWVISSWAIGTEGGTGVPLATITAHDSIRTLTVTVKIDAASQEIVVRLAGSVTSAGLRTVYWTLAGLDLAGGHLIVPANSGIVLDASHPIDTFIQYPNTWHAQMAVYEAGLGSFVLYSPDTQLAFKQLHATTRGDSTVDVQIATEATAPFGTATSVPTVEWRLKAFAGNWRVAAQVYRDWLTANRSPVSNAAHPWVSNIRAVATMRTLDPAILAPLAAQVVPAQTLLYLVDWRADPFGVNFPNYTPRAGVASFVTQAHALGFKVMLHFDMIGVSPMNGDYASLQAWHARGSELLELLGWNWDAPPSTTNRYAYINPAAPAYRALWINRVSVAVNAIGPDALHLDISGPLINDGNGLIGGLTYPQGAAQFNQDIIAAFPNLALGGEGQNDILYRYHSFAQAWWPATPNVGHPIATFLWGPQMRYYGHLGQPAARESGFKDHLAELEQRAILPALPVGSPSDLDTGDPANTRLLNLIQSWQSHAFEPAWNTDWTGALVRYEGSAASTAALTDTGTKLSLAAAGSTLFTIAHDANQVASPPYVGRWLAFDAAKTYGLDPARRYFLDQAVQPTSTHVTSLPAGVQIGPGSLMTSAVAHLEVQPASGQAFDFQKGLLNAHPGVRYNGADFPLGNGAFVQVQSLTAGGDTRSGIFIHPPYLGQLGGETFVEYSLPVPGGASLQFDVAIADNAACTDGVTFRVTASGTELWHEHILPTGWHHQTLSLAAYGGTTIPLRLISNPGPGNNPNCDWSMWNQIAITSSTAPFSTTLVLGPGSVFSGFTGDGSFAPAGLSGPLSNVPVPGAFTVFTQPGPLASSGTNLVNVSFDVWNGVHGEMVVPGPTFSGVGSVGAASVGGVVKNPAIFAHATDHGRTVLSWTIRLPNAPLRLWWSAGIGDGASSTDGVDFQVFVNGAMKWHRTTMANQWIPGNTDLSSWAGQSVLVELMTDSIGYANFDWGWWADLVLRDAAFTDASLTAGLTTIKRAHIIELRDRIDALRARASLNGYNWTDLSLTIGTSIVRAPHIADLRTALTQVYTAMALPPPSFTDPILGAGVTIKAVHIAELRAAVMAIE